MVRKILAIVILSLLVAFAIEKLISLQSNTLASQNSWYSLKKLTNSYFLGFMGTDDFLFERQSTAGESLNLGAWFGYQDVLYKKPLPDFKEYKVNFSLDSDKSYFLIYLNCDLEKCWALRTSANSEYPTGLYLIMNSGEFVKTIALNSESAVSTGQHQVRVERAASNYEIFLDNMPLLKFEYAFEYKPIRFMGSYAPSRLHNIEYTDIASRKTVIDFKATFDSSRFVTIFCFLLIICGVAALALKSQPQRWYIIFSSQLMSFVLVLIFFMFDYFYWSHLYLTTKPNPTLEASGKFISALENYRKNIFISNTQILSQQHFLHEHIWFKTFQDLQQKDMGIGINDFQIIDTNGNTVFKKDISAELDDINNKNYIKIAFAGGSQSWGTGATRLNKTWPSLIIQDLAKKTNRKVIGINFSICGGVLYNITQRAEIINKFKPDLFIFNFGANDSVTPEKYFSFQLKEFKNKVNLSEINTLFSIEALSHEASNDETYKGKMIRNFTEANGLSLVSLHEHFKTPAVVDSGNMWHDQLHFTDFGHTQASRFFTNTQVYNELLMGLKKSTSK